MGLGLRASFVERALALDHRVVQSLMCRAGYQLRVHPKRGIRIATLLQLFGQMTGLYLVEFFWQKGDKSDHHVIAGLQLPLHEHMNLNSQNPQPTNLCLY
jgi:hypothetical protein